MKTEAVVHHQSTHCLNCGAAATVHFCQYCGQETAAHVPGAGEYAHEFIGHFVALESKLWKTLALLLFKPGRLTRDYIEGKRVRYVLPLRLYLTLSLVFFAVFKWDAHDFVQAPRPAVQVSQQADLGKDSDRGPHLLKLDNSDRSSLSQKLGEKLAKRVDHFSDLTFEQQMHEAQAAFFEWAPYAIFALMPVFALYLKLLYLGSGRRYGEHLLFALHTNAFAFLMLTLMLALPSGIPFLQPALGLWLMFYLPTAMRKVYGGSRLATWGRWTVLMFLHLMGMVAAVVGALGLAVVG